ncbi:MAG: chromosomal replication initiator protein DnaA [Bacilli bacterium]|jgi:chromosomal replication initiator protein|nr:chromosomal replication initiator protein DnaA [Bacilli bacterium]HCJ31639.1 chromosomal replication initiator protein DnaA [Bacillota bacterium]
MNIDNIWNKFLSIMKTKLNSLSYDTWFSTSKLVELNEEHAVIIVPTIAHKKHLSESYIDIISDIFNSITGTNFNFEFVLENEYNNKKITVKKEEEEELGVPYNSSEKANLNPDYVFENFIVGESNRFAQATALAVAENPGKMYNPLFIYGNSGLGKTHLMQAIGNYIVKNTNKRVLYVTSDQFINDFLGLNKKDKDGTNFDYVDLFKDKYRNIDVLIIDDIQFLGNAPKTQNEFFHTFNTLYDDKKQIIISSDSSPDDLKHLEDRLRTRFNWGLKVNIFPPDNDLRREILRKKMANMDFSRHISDDAIDYIANMCPSDVRSLEGALTRVCAYSTIFFQEEITLDLTIEALKGTITPMTNFKNDIQKIQRVVAEHYNVSVEDLKSKKRVATIAFPRQIAIYLSRQLTDESFPKIGIEFGGRDHSTVMHSCDKIEKERKENKQLDNIINEIISKLE